MSRSTRSLRAESGGVAARALAAIFAAAELSADAIANHLHVDAPPLPTAIAALAPGLRPQGGGEMTFFGFSIYDGWFWSGAHAWAPNGIHALDLHYHRSLDGASIADRSVAEIEGIGVGSAEQRHRWGEAT